MRWWTLLLVAVTACGPAVRSRGTRVRTMTTVPSGKTLAVYRAETFATESRDVPEAVVVQGMRASSMFFDEDIRALAPDIAGGLAKLEQDERIVVETNDTAIHFFIANHELQVVGFRQGQEITRHASPIPAPAVKTELASEPHAEPKPVLPPEAADRAPPPPAPPPVVVSTPQPALPPPATKPAPPPKPVVKAKPPPGRRLTEQEIRKKLDELHHLHSKSLITDDEYHQKRKALLDQL